MARVRQGSLSMVRQAGREWDDLVDRLAAWDVRYLATGRGVPISPDRDVPVAPLLLDLARSEHGRLRDALIALLLRHPEHAADAERVAASLPPHDPARHPLEVSIVVAAALQTAWEFSLKLYLPTMAPIEAGFLASRLGFPSPREDFGRTCLAAAAQCLRARAPFPFNYEAGWEAAVRRLLTQLVQEARHGGA